MNILTNIEDNYLDVFFTDNPVINILSDIYFSIHRIEFEFSETNINAFVYFNENFSLDFYKIYNDNFKKVISVFIKNSLSIDIQFEDQFSNDINDNTINSVYLKVKKNSFIDLIKYYNEKKD
jgi:hypothetical protein